ncbi:MAG TPA: propanediol dehydratase small subunit PduE, partial [Firmicutes bacterium]|nr:propanediol dehydratase small subunit PduE [Bacillota bacterium]
MVQENLIEQVVREVLKSLQTGAAPAPACGTEAGTKVGLDPAR